MGIKRVVAFIMIIMGMIILLLKPTVLQAKIPVLNFPVAPPPLPPSDLRPPVSLIDGFKFRGLPFENMKELDVMLNLADCLPQKCLKLKREAHEFEDCVSDLRATVALFLYNKAHNRLPP